MATLLLSLVQCQGAEDLHNSEVRKLANVVLLPVILKIN